MRRFVKLVPGLLIVLLLGVCGAAYAAHEEIPRISIADLKALIDGKADIVVLDCQAKSAYAKGHIPGAVSLPWVASLNPEDVERLPAGKPIVTYCDCGPGEAFWGYAPTLCKPPKEFGPYSENTMIPRFTTTDQIHIVVVGGPGKQSQIWPTFPTSMRPVSVVVDE